MGIILAAEIGAGGRPGKGGNTGFLYYWHLNSDKGIFDHGGFLPNLSLFLMQMSYAMGVYQILSSFLEEILDFTRLCLSK